MKKRLDMLVLEKGLESSRERARALIMAGSVYVDGEKATKPGDTYDENAVVELRGEKLRYVSRGGYKLEKALSEFKINLQGKTCMDVGCSTGGFIDCMLQNGASKVLGVDVGYGQLDWGLRNDKRVQLLEKTNVRYLEKSQMLGLCINFVTADVSFISLTKVLPPVKALVGRECEFVCLVKPQFEVEKQEVGKGGIIKDKSLHKKVLLKIAGFLKAQGFVVCGITFSPIKGAHGNTEYLVYFKNSTGDLEPEGLGTEQIFGIIEEVVKEAGQET